MNRKIFWIVLILGLFLSGATALATGGGDGGGGDDAGMTDDGIAAGGGWSSYDPSVAEGIIGADGQLETIEQNYRKGILQQQAELSRKTKVWLEEGKYYEKLEKRGKTVQTAVNVAGTVVNVVSGGATSKINQIGQHTANALESGMESYNAGKSAPEIFNDAMLGAGKKAAKVDTIKNMMKMINNLHNSSPNIKPPPAITYGEMETDGSFGAGGPALDDDPNHLM